MSTYLTHETCTVCHRHVVIALASRPLGVTSQHCCRARCTFTSEEVAPETTLLGFYLGEPVEADIYRGGRQDDDGITTGSRLVTKRGRIVAIDEIGPYRSVAVLFDDGDYQSCGAAALDGTKPGYPCAAFRRVTSATVAA